MRRLKIIATYLNLFIEKYSTCLLDRAGQFGHIKIEVKRVRAILFKTILCPFKISLGNYQMT